jgi:hypothetical protein
MATLHLKGFQVRTLSIQRLFLALIRWDYSLENDEIFD